MRNVKKHESFPASSGRNSAASDKKDFFNDEEVSKKIDDLRKKARQEMMDFEALDGFSLAHYVRIKQATSRLLQDDESQGKDNEELITAAVEVIKEEERQKMARNILKKWQNFTKGDPEPREVRPKRRKSVRFKDEVESKDTAEHGPEKVKTSTETSRNVQIVFPAIIQSRPSPVLPRQKRKKKENFMGSLPPISQAEEKSKEHSNILLNHDMCDLLKHDRLPKLKLRPVNLTTRTPPPSEDDEQHSEKNSPELVINNLQDNPQADLTTPASLELFLQSNPNSPTVSRQPTPFPSEGHPSENTLQREPTMFLKLKKKFNKAPNSKTVRGKVKFDKRIQNYEVSEESDEIATEISEYSGA